MDRLLAFYKNHLNEVLLPFWLRALDRERGGVYTCFNNTGTERVGTDKYTWSQGRFIWLLSRMAAMCQDRTLEGDGALYLEHAAKTVEFLNRHVFLDNGNCAYVLSEDGEMIEPVPGQGFDTSFYADCFVVLGFAEYAKAAGDRATLERALKLYRRIEERLASGDARSEPYPVPPGYAAHSFSMIMLNVSQELADALQQMEHAESAEIRNKSVGYMDKVMNRFVRPDGLVTELLAEDDSLRDTLLARHLAPGHAIECMWFVMTEAQKTGRPDLVGKAAEVVKRSFEIGWDPEFGGLYRYVDYGGGQPQGRLIGDRFEALIRDTWDMKIWWPHSEALYTLLLAYRMTHEQVFWDYYERTHDYVFRTFPNPDRSVGEWIQIRDRQGEPVQKLVALPVKDPYHIIRNVLLAIELLSANRPDRTA